MAQSVKFYRLGLTTPVSLATYESYKKGLGELIFARVQDGNGKWDSENSVLVPPTYYIWANGMEYKVADADALEFVFNKVNTLAGADWDGESIQELIDKSLEEYKLTPEKFMEIVSDDYGTVHVSIAADGSVAFDCEGAGTTEDITAAATVGYLTKGTEIPEGTSIQDLVDMIFNPELGVDPVKPTVKVTNSGTAAGTYEIGTEVTPKLSATYTDGKFTAKDGWGADQKANCAEGTTTYYVGSTAIANGADTSTFNVVAGTTNCVAKTTYAKSSTVPVTNKGNELQDVSIAAGTATSNAIAYKGEYYVFYGELDAAPAGDDLYDTIRGLNKTLGATKLADQSFSKYLVIAVPNGKSVTLRDSMDLDYVAQDGIAHEKLDLLKTNNYNIYYWNANNVDTTYIKINIA